MGGMMAAIGSAALKVGGNMAGGLFGAKTQAHYQRHLNRHYHRDLVHGLRAAGLNPILAAGGGFGGSGGNIAQPDMKSGDDAVEGAKAAYEMQMLSNSAKKMKADAKKSEVEAKIAEEYGPDMAFYNRLIKMSEEIIANQSALQASTNTRTLREQLEQLKTMGAGKEKNEKINEYILILLERLEEITKNKSKPGNKQLKDILSPSPLAR